MRSVVLKHSTGQVQNTYGKLEDSTEDIPIEMAISLLSGNKFSTNNMITTESTHIGLTTYDTSTISSTDIIQDGNDEYTIDYIPPTTGRINQVFLRLVK
jgi:hypothetical protein